MGEQAAKIGKKLEGFGENFFANLGWTELTQDKEIKCTRSSHKKKTHGIDLLCKFTNPYIAGNQGIVVECKNRQMGSITRATIEEWVKELINNIECAQSAPELVDVDLRNTTLNTGLLLIHANDKFDQQKFYRQPLIIIDEIQNRCAAAAACLHGVTARKGHAAAVRFEAAAGASHQNQCPARRCGRRPGRCTASGSRIFHTAG